MKSRSLTKEIVTSVIGFGGGSVSGSAGGYGYGDVSEKQALETLEHAFRRGITLFDTAPIYGFGESERRIGLALAGHSSLRKKMVIVTKLGVTWNESREKVFIDNGPDTIRRMLEKSLQDLRTDYIDVYMIHWPDAATPIESTMETLKEYKRAGVIRAIGVSNFGPDLIERASRVEAVETAQGDFNALNTSAAKDLFPYLRQTGAGFMSYGTLAKGLLTGRVVANRKYDASDYRARAASLERQRLALEGEVRRFGEMASAMGVTPAILATAYVLSYPEVSTALCGAKSKEQVDSLLEAADLDIPPRFKDELDSLAAQATPRYLESFQ